MTVRILTIDEAADVLREGAPAVFPTETVYGLGLSVRDAAGPQALYDLKQRSHNKPIAWLIADIDDLTRFGKAVPDFALTLARTFWPGPLTLVVKASDEVPEAFRSAEGTIGLRMPDNDTALALIRKVGCPLATTSANRAGHAAAGCFADLDPELLEAVGVAVEDDIEKSGVASTVLDCTQDHPSMMRVGAITAADIRALS